MGKDIQKDCGVANPPPLRDQEELRRYQQYSEELRGLCTRAHDCAFYVMDSTTGVDIMSVAGADKCPFSKYEH